MFLANNERSRLQRAFPSNTIGLLIFACKNFDSPVHNKRLLDFISQMKVFLFPSIELTDDGKRIRKMEKEGCGSAK